MGMFRKSPRRIHAVLRGLGHHGVAHALRAQPEAWRGLETGGKSDQRITGDVGLGETHLLGLGPVHIHKHDRLVQSLLDMHVGRAGNLADARDHVIGNLVISRHVRADNLNVDGRGQAEVQDLADDVRRLEEELRARELLGQLAAEIADVVRRGAMFGIQRNQNLGIRGADHAAVAVGEVDAAVRHSDVVQNRVQFVARYFLAEWIAPPAGRARQSLQCANPSGRASADESGRRRRTGTGPTRAAEPSIRLATQKPRKTDAKQHTVMQAPFQQDERIVRGSRLKPSSNR